jgi:ABC-type antimicrobial peptide transport system permease subunit
MPALVDRSLVRPQSLSLLVTSFAIVALMLSAIGIYGVMGYYVQQHLKEISLRMALGGSQADVARLVVGQGMTVVGLGIVVGVAAAIGATRLMSSLLFHVGALNPAVYLGAGTLLFAVAALACAVPAFRAIQLQPATVLRNE